MKKLLETYLIENGEVSKEQIQEMYDLRRSVFSLREETDPERDFLKFSIYARTSKYIYIFKDGEYKIQGFYFVKYSLVTVNAQEVVMIEPEYALVSEDYQSGDDIDQSFRHMVLSLNFRYFFKRVYMVGCSYPSSYIKFRKMVQEIWDLGREDIPAFEKAILLEYSRRLGSQRSLDSPIIQMPTVPRSLEVKGYDEMYAHYSSVNPRWKEGFGLKILLRLDLRDVVSAVVQRFYGKLA